MPFHILDPETASLRLMTGPILFRSYLFGTLVFQDEWVNPSADHVLIPWLHMTSGTANR